MQFSIGDKVMYPKVGAGQITSEEHRELVEGFQHYYVIKIFDTEATAYVPMRKMDELGVRLVMSLAEFAQVLNTLQSVPRQLSKDFKERQEKIREKLETARPIPIAEAVRDLTWRRQHANLTKIDEDLLRRGRALLAGEMAVMTDTRILEAQDAIDATLKIAMASEIRRAQHVQTANAAPTSTSETLAHKLFRKGRGVSAHAQAQDIQSHSRND